MLDDCKIGVIGAGNMGGGLIAGWVNYGNIPATNITATDPIAAALVPLASLGVVTSDELGQAVIGRDVVILAVKPQTAPALISDLSSQLQPHPPLISIMAGVTIDSLRDDLGHRAVVRVMPNTPAQIGEGMLVWTASEEVSAEQRSAVQRMLATMGRELYVPAERQIDMATAVSGSGPGFVYLMIESMIDGAVQIGLSRDLAEELVLQTVKGSAQFAQESDAHVAALRNMVTSPGGTTAAGLRAMERHGARTGMIEAIVEAYRRARELGQ